MICNKDLLFVHVPKTGGMSITVKLLETLLPLPVYYSVATGHEGVLPRKGIVLCDGDRHGNLETAVNWASSLGFSLDQFRFIVGVIRNPYDMEVSRYFYLRMGHEWDRGEDQNIALTSDFEKFATTASYFGRQSSQIYRYFTINGNIPSNLRILRFENLEQELQGVYSDLRIEYGGALPRDNATNRSHYLYYLTPAAEEAIYNRFRWVFDQGMYPRHNFDNRP